MEEKEFVVVEVVEAKPLAAYAPGIMKEESVVVANDMRNLLILLPQLALVLLPSSHCLLLASPIPCSPLIISLLLIFNRRRLIVLSLVCLSLLLNWWFSHKSTLLT
ncbi:hypothetical protein AMTRI_Chr01g128990 [Amborella trichopoda]